MSRRACARATAETRLPPRRDFRYDKLSARKTANIITSPCGCSLISARPCIVTSYHRSDQVQYYLCYFILCRWPVEKNLRIVAVAFVLIYEDDYTRRYNVGNNRLICIPVLRASLGKTSLSLSSPLTRSFSCRVLVIPTFSRIFLIPRNSSRLSVVDRCDRFTFFTYLFHSK